MSYKAPLEGILLLSDIDGTLLPHGGEIPVENFRAIEKFKTLGGKFGLSTGRSMESTRCALSDKVITNCPSVVYNGGAIYDFEDGKLSLVYSLPAAARCKIFEIIEKFPSIGCEVHINCHVYCINHSERSRYHMLREASEYHVTPISDLPIGDLNKAVFIGESEEIERLAEYAMSLDISGEEYYFLRSEETLYEILPKVATKGNALITLGEMLGIEREKIYAIGDYYNDIDLLKAAGVAATVSGAPDAVKEYADIITCGCEEGAVAELIERIIADATAENE